MIIVDTNIIAYFWLPGEFSELAEQVLQKDCEWCSPILWKSEFRNVVAAFYRRGIIDFEQSLEVLLKAEEQLADSEYNINSFRVMERVKKSKCTAYDCEYVVLAELLNCKLVTNDKEIVKNFPDVAIEISDFLSASQ
jgi:predicted nucleic acid-binding protein